MVRLERQVAFLAAERRRLERLLGQALRVAVAETSVSEVALLGALCELVDTDPARAAFLDKRRADAA